MKKLIVLSILFQCLSFQAASQNIKMNGIIIDSITNTPIPFTNIGVFNKNKGTISNSKGIFNISFTNKFKYDSLTIQSFKLLYD